MKRRDFITGAALAAGAALAPGVLAADDEAELKRLVEQYYRLYSTGLDKEKYRALLTDDYLLLENGEIWNAERDIAEMPSPDDGYRRTDNFEFKSAKIHGDIAYLVYFLTSEIADKKEGVRHRKYLESTICQRERGGA